jgi:DNA-binding response OmpR family regulator
MSKGRILVIDDSQTLLEQMKARLSQEGYDVVTSSRALGNSEILRGAEVVLVDFHMPGVNGASMLRWMRKAVDVLGQSTTLFCLFTTDDAEAAKYREHGFDKVVTSKGNADAVVPQVNALFASLAIRKVAAAKAR